MPYLPIDLDGRRDCLKAASLLGVSPGDVSWGLQEAWEHVWRTHFAGRPNADVLSEIILLGCLGPVGAKPRAIDVLVEFGFLERLENGYRIRGAAKWLFGLEGKRRGGHAAKSNLVPGGGRKPKKSAENQPRADEDVSRECRDLCREGAETQPIGRPSALTPSTQHPASRESVAGEKPPATRKPKAEAPNPRHAPMVKALVEAAPGYAFQPRDAKAVADLLAMGTDAEILARWRRARARAGYPLVRTLPELAAHWEHFREDAKPAPREEPSCRLL